MDQLPYELRFVHKFNLYKTSGLLIEEDDLRSMARVYGVRRRDLQRLEDTFSRHIEDAAEELVASCTEKPLTKSYTVAAIGDSITSDRESYAKILKKVWKDNPMRSVIDCAVSGDTTVDVIRRLYPTVIGLAFDWAVIFLGTNDSRANDDEFDHAYVSVDSYTKNMGYIIEVLRKRNKEIVLVTIPYADNERMQSFFTELPMKYDYRRIDRTNGAIRKLSKQYGTVLCEFAGKLLDIGGDFLEEDGLHINVEGQKILCGMLLDILP
jgi:lysophospholipase L1-like esterase